MKTLLVVEDDENLRRLYLILLKAQGYNVLEAPDGERGLELALAHAPHLILTDGMMPRLDGLQMLRQLRQRAPQSAPALFISALAEMPAPEAQMAVGIVQAIPKPFAFETVLAAVKVWVGESEE